jgi:hypothetical protein
MPLENIFSIAKDRIIAPIVTIPDGDSKSEHGIIKVDRNTLGIHIPTSPHLLIGAFGLASE